MLRILITALFVTSFLLPFTVQISDRHEIVHALHKTIQSHQNSNHDHKQHEHEHLEAKIDSDHHPILFGLTSFMDQSFLNLFSTFELKNKSKNQYTSGEKNSFILAHLKFGYGLIFSPPKNTQIINFQSNLISFAQLLYLTTQRLRL